MPYDIVADPTWQAPTELPLEHQVSNATMDVEADSTLNLIDWIRDQFALLPNVEAVYLHREIHTDSDRAITVLRVWTVLQQATPAARRSVYDCEAKICRTFPKFEFDFYSTDRSEEPRVSGCFRILPTD